MVSVVNPQFVQAHSVHVCALCLHVYGVSGAITDDMTKYQAMNAGSRKVSGAA